MYLGHCKLAFSFLHTTYCTFLLTVFICACVNAKFKQINYFEGGFARTFDVAEPYQGVITSPHILHLLFLKHLIPSHPALCPSSYTASIFFPISLSWGPFCSFHYHSHSMLSFWRPCVIFISPCVSCFVKDLSLFDLTMGDCIVQVTVVCFTFLFCNTHQPK